MVIHHKKLTKNIRLGLKPKLKYSSEYSFIPLKIWNDAEYTDCVFQTPKLFIPYGKQTVSEDKQIMDLSFQNQINDNAVVQFKQNLEIIYRLIHSKFNSYQVNSFLKLTNYDECMRFKVNSNTQFYDSSKNRIYKIDSFSYGTFIIQLHGLWIYKNEIWFQWILLQGKIEKPLFLKEYSLLEEKSDTLNKYDKMLQMGIPKEAVELRKKLDGKIPVPPPPPPMLSSKTTPVSKIKASDLQKIILKKAKPLLKKKPQRGEFEPPSLEELQITISKLKKSKP